MANGYKNFVKGISLVPNTTQNNTQIGDVEFVNDKLQIHNAAIGQDAVVTENTPQTLTNKNLQDLTFKIVGNADATKKIGWAVTAATTGKTLTIASAHTDNRTLTLPDATDTLVARNTTDTLTNKTLTAPQIDTAYGVGVADLNIGSNLSMNSGKNIKLNNNSQTVTVGASSTATASYPVTMPDAAPLANTALVWDGTKFKWGAAGGADASGANDDILATTFRARILDSFDDTLGTSSSTINPSVTATTAVQDSVNQLYSMQYSVTTISNANTTSPTLAATPGFLAIGDTIILGQEIRTVTQVSPSLEIDAGFTTPSGSCTVSETVLTKELYGQAFDGASISSAFGAAPFSEYLIDYQDADSPATFYTPNVTPVVAYSVSQDGISWSAPAVRPQNQTEQITSGAFAAPGTTLYVRLFANKNTGSGTVNLFEYRAYMQKSPTVASGTLNQAYTKLAIPLSGSQQNCSLSVVGGKTRVTLTTWVYSNGVNPGSAYGALDVYINGQIIPRFVDPTTTSGAYYTEFSNSIIDLDSDYSTTPYAIQIIQRQPMANFTSSTGSSSSAVGSGLKNYLTTYKGNAGNGDFETGDTTGWSLFNTTLTGVTPTGAIASGAGSINTFQATTATPLAANYSLLVGASGSLGLGQGFISNAFTIDLEDRAKVLTFSFAYQAISGTMNFSGTSANTWAVYLYDGANWIQPAGVYNLVQSSGVGLATGTFQTTSTATTYRIAVVCINTATNISMEFDSFFVGPQISVTAPAMSDWVSYVPNFAGFTSFTSSDFQYRRVGSNIEVRGRFVSSSIGSGSQLRIHLPFNLTSSISSLQMVGSFQSGDLGAVAQGVGVSCSVLAEPSLNYLTFSTRNNSQSGLTALNGNNVIVAGVIYSLFASVPITGWSSNTVASADTDTRIVDFAGSQVSQAVTANVTNISFTTVKDTHGAWSTNQYTVPVSGDYLVSGSFISNAAGAGDVYKTGTRVAYLGGAVPGAGASGGGSVLVTNCVAGDNITIRFTQNATITAGYLSIYRLSGPAIVQASETVVASYYNSLATFAASPTVPINFNTAEFDSHNAVTTSTTAWKFTAPISGTYDVATYVYGQNPGTSVTFYLYKNQASVGTATKVITYQNSGTNSSGSCLIKLNAGDFIDMRPSVARTITGGALNTDNCSYIQIKRVGN
jgi:hypothetical protein